MTTLAVKYRGSSLLLRWVRAQRRASLERAIRRSEFHVRYLEESIKATRSQSQVLRVKLALLEDPR